VISLIGCCMNGGQGPDQRNRTTDWIQHRRRLGKRRHVRLSPTNNCNSLPTEHHLSSRLNRNILPHVKPVDLGTSGWWVKSITSIPQSSSFTDATPSKTLTTIANSRSTTSKQKAARNAAQNSAYRHCLYHVNDRSFAHPARRAPYGALFFS